MKNKQDVLAEWNEKIESTKGQIKYAQEKLDNPGTPNWEKKEWHNTISNLEQELLEYELVVQNIQENL